jgi:PTS system glucitol/sorbitol-specific IIA component
VTATGEPEVVYASTVTAVGDQVPAFVDAGILVLFGDTSPSELHAISVLHRPEVTASGPVPGDVIEIGEHAVEVLAVGHVVEDNLLNLGHMDLKSDGRREPKMPGDVCVPEGCLRRPEVGDAVRILRPAPSPAEPSAGVTA